MPLRSGGALDNEYTRGRICRGLTAVGKGITVGWFTEAANVIAGSPSIDLPRIFERTATHHVATSEMTSTPPIKWSYNTGGDPLAVVVADINADGINEVIFTCTDGYIYCLNPDGELIWRTNIYLTSWTESAPTLYDINGNGYLEILVVGMDSTTSYAVYYCLNHDGTIRWSYDSIDWAESYSVCPAVYDIDGDGEFEILTGDYSRAYCFKPDGTLKWSFNDGTFYAWGAVAVADIDADGQIDVVFPHDWAAISGGFYCFNPDGTVKWTYIDNTDHLQAALADIDGDGQLEILSKSGTKCHCLNSDGTFKWEYDCGETVYTSICVCDADKDGEVEIYFASYRAYLYALKYDGTYKWHVHSYHGAMWRSISGVVAVDIDDDGDLELIVLWYGLTKWREITCFENDGTRKWWRVDPDPAGFYTTYAMCIEDADQDGKAEIFAGITENYLRCYWYGG